MKYLRTCFLAVLIFAIPVFAQNKSETIVKNARELANQKKFVEAAAEISKAIELEPNNPDLLLMRAWHYMGARNNEALIGDVERAVSLNPTDKKTLYSGATLLMVIQNYREAVKICDNLIALGTPDLYSLDLTIRIKIYLKDYNGAYKDVSKAIELFPEEAYFKSTEARLLSLSGNSDKAIELYSSLILAYEKKIIAEKNNKKKEKLKNDLTQFLFGRAHDYFLTGSTDLSQADLNRAVEIYPIARIFYLRAQHYKKLKMYAESLSDLNKTIELSDKDESLLSFYYLDRGDVFRALRKYTEAIQDYEQVIKLQDSSNESVKKRISEARQKLQEEINPPK